MRIRGLKDIAHQFDALLIDQFGVIHDGQKLYPGAARVLAELKALGIPVVIMTNSGKRAASNVARIVKMGIPRDQFVDCVSSGEVAWQSLQSKLPRNTAYLVGKDGEDYGFDPIRFVDDPTQADVMLILGSNAPKTSLADYEKAFRGMTLPAICCNPDKQMLTSQGLQPAPGAVADVYARLGGRVTWIGKPYPGIYEFALQQLSKVPSFPRMREPRLSTHAMSDSLGPRVCGDDEQKMRVLCIGDSAEHDVAGGRNAGLSTLLVLQGVSAGMSGEGLSPAPDYVMPAFQWDA